VWDDVPVWKAVWDDVPVWKAVWDQVPVRKAVWDDVPVWKALLDKVPVWNPVWEEVPVGKAVRGKICIPTSSRSIVYPGQLLIYQILWSVFKPCSILRADSMKYTVDVQSELECCESCTWRESMTLLGTQMMGWRMDSGMSEWHLQEEATKIKASFGGRETEGV